MLKGALIVVRLCAYLNDRSIFLWRKAFGQDVPLIFWQTCFDRV
jgi:hypothetical protein